MSKPRKLLPITEYLMEHVYDKMWHYKNPERYLDRVLRKWFGDMKEKVNMSKNNENKEKLLKRMTQKMEEYLMPKYSDTCPAMDVLQIVIDSGYTQTEDVGELVEALESLIDNDDWGKARQAIAKFKDKKG